MRQPHVAVLAADDAALLQQPGRDPHIGQLLRWYATLPVEARFDVHELARRRHARVARPSFEVLPAEALSASHDDGPRRG